MINTKVIKINPSRIDFKKLKEAGQAIRDGKLVVFPTETVYGLGADALNVNAVLKIFQAKNRPFQDPLIVHVSTWEEAIDLVEDFPKIARTLGQLFWPGPLTMVMKKNKLISDLVTSELDTVAIRIPDHQVALGLIREAKRPIAAPSANIFSRTSPTRVEHVIADLKGRVEIIIDSGETMIGVESTVLDVTELPLKILRLGGITFERLKEVTPDIIITTKDRTIKKSPGMFNKHYAPKAQLILVEDGKEEMIQKIWRLALQYKNKGNKVGIIASKENSAKYPGFLVKTIGEAQDLEACAHNLYAQLRALDEQKCQIIISESFENRGLGRAIMDRLRRAAG
jgi:L-threonylcarbamoyladenylate synthase